MPKTEKPDDEILKYTGLKLSIEELKKRLECVWLKTEELNAEDLNIKARIEKLEVISSKEKEICTIKKGEISLKNDEKELVSAYYACGEPKEKPPNICTLKVQAKCLSYNSILCLSPTITTYIHGKIEKEEKDAKDL